MVNIILVNLQNKSYSRQTDEIVDSDELCDLSPNISLNNSDKNYLSKTKSFQFENQKT